MPNKSKRKRKIGIKTGITSLCGALGLIVACKMNFMNITSGFAPDVSGVWKLTVKNQDANLEKFRGNVYQWKMFLQQNECEIKGNGEKTMENDSAISAVHRQKIVLRDGRVGYFKLSFNYDLLPADDSKSRRTTGRMEFAIVRKWKVVGKVERIYGTFQGTAADSRGTLEAIPDLP